MAVAKTHPVTLSIEQQTTPTQSAERQPLVYQFPTCLPLAISAVENELPTQDRNWPTPSCYVVQSIYRLGLTSL